VLSKNLKKSHIKEGKFDQTINNNNNKFSNLESMKTLAKPLRVGIVGFTSVKKLKNSFNFKYFSAHKNEKIISPQEN